MYNIFRNGQECREVTLNDSAKSKSAITVGKVLTWIGCSFLFVIFCMFLVMVLLGARRASPFSRAKGTLRSIGSTQAVFFDKYGRYGTFHDLLETNYIAEGYTPENMIENFDLTWQVSNLSTVSDESSIGAPMHSFTIVAWPEDTRPGYLLTFGVSEDQIVRVYNPDDKTGGRNQYNGPTDPRVQTWDPIL